MGTESDAIDVGRGPRCENCGREAAGEEVAKNILLCERCRSRYQLVVAAHSVISWAAFIGIAFYAMPHLLATATRNPLLSQQSSSVLTGPELFAFYVSLIVGVIVHECSHAACATRVGFTVSQIRLGTGPILYKRRVRGLVAVVQLVPFGGLTVWRPGTTRVTTAKRAAVAAAGPLSNLVLAALFWAARSYQAEIAIPAACANLLLFIENVAPRPYSRTSGTANDGWQVLMNLTNSHWARSHARRIDLVNRCGAPARNGRTSEVLGRLRLEIEEAGGDYPDAEALLCTALLSVRESQAHISEGFERSSRLVRDQRAFPVLRAMALNNRAYMLAVGGWPNLMGEAEWAARAALQRSPTNASMLGTLALVLVRLGRFDEAEAIANKIVHQRLQAISSTSGAELVELRRSLAANRCTLALLYAHTNRRDAAWRELVEARSLDAACVLVPELERVLAPGPHAGVPAAPGAAQRDPHPRPQTHPIVVRAPAALGSSGVAGTASPDHRGGDRGAHC